MKCAICERKIDEKYTGAIYRLYGKVICQDCAKAICNIIENKTETKAEVKVINEDKDKANNEKKEEEKIRKKEDIV